MEPSCAIFADCIEQLDDLLLTYTVVNALKQLLQFCCQLCAGLSLLFHAVYKLEVDQLVEVKAVRRCLLVSALGQKLLNCRCCNPLWSEWLLSLFNHVLAYLFALNHSLL